MIAGKTLSVRLDFNTINFDHINLYYYLTLSKKLETQ